MSDRRDRQSDASNAGRNWSKRASRWASARRRSSPRCSTRPRSRKSRAADASFAAVPFFQPHQLIVIAIGRVGRIELRGERLAAGQPARRRFGEGAEREVENSPPAMSLSARTHLPKVPRSRISDQYSKISGSPLHAVESAGAADQPEQAQLERKTLFDRLARWRLAGLVIDDGKAAARQAGRCGRPGRGL